MKDDDIRSLFAPGVPDDSDDEYDSPMESRSSYYERHQATLQAKQRQYNYVNRTGLRRVSKAERARAQRRRQKVMNGERGTYSDPLGWTCNSTRTDTDRTEAMALQEAAIYDALHNKRGSLRKSIDFPSNYCVYLETCIEQVKDTVYDSVHFKRRLIAGYAQELALWRQGEASYRAARGDGVLILKGNGVNRHAARRMFGL